MAVVELRECIVCRRVKEGEEFYTQNGFICNDCHIQNHRKAGTTHYRKAGFARRLQVQYGITLAEFEAMFEKQKGKCALCHEVKPLTVDHCHNTLKVRGLLCRPCNFGMSYVDREDWLSKALVYAS